MKVGGNVGSYVFSNFGASVDIGVVGEAGSGYVGGAELKVEDEFYSDNDSIFSRYIRM